MRFGRRSRCTGGGGRGRGCSLGTGFLFLAALVADGLGGLVVGYGGWVGCPPVAPRPRLVSRDEGGRGGRPHVCEVSVKREEVLPLVWHRCRPVSGSTRFPLSLNQAGRQEGRSVEREQFSFMEPFCYPAYQLVPGVDF